MKRILALAVLFVAVGTLVATVARTRSATARPPLSAKSPAAVDVDFITLNDTMRSVKVVELMRSPLAFAKKKIRIDGIAVSGKDGKGAQHYGLKIYDAGGCCPILTVEYEPNFTFAPLRDGTPAILEGEAIVLGLGDQPRLIVGNATICSKQRPTTTR